MTELKKTKTSGRIKAEFDLALLEADSSTDIILQDEDEVIIPEITNYVYVYGQVATQGTAKFDPTKDINFYLETQEGH